MGRGRRIYRAGPLAVTLERDALRWIRWHDVEVLRGLEVTVRDSAWGSVAPTIGRLRSARTAQGSRLVFTSRYATESMGLDARVTIDLDAAGSVHFSLSATATRTFKRNRIGIIALYPIEVSGQPVTFTSDRSVKSTRWPDQIEPDVIATDLTSMVWEVVPGLRASLEFAGERWEIEDQRNWLDASFKAYPTPLALPFPVLVPEGSVVRQSAVLTLDGRPRRRSHPRPTPIAMRRSSSGHLPMIGSEVPPEAGEPNDAVVSKVAALSLGFVRGFIDVDAAASHIRADRLAAWARRLGIGLELEVQMRPTSPAEVLSRFDGIDIVVAYPFDAERGQGYDSSDAVVRSLRQALHGLGVDAPVGGGTRANYTELNRGRPAVDGLDAITYAVNPQVHALDEASMVESLAVLSLTVEEARRLVPDRPISIVISLRPRFNAAAKEAMVGADGRLRRADPRQDTAFAAAWTLGAITTLARSSVRRIVIGETHGQAGLVDLGAADGPRWTPSAGVVASLSQTAGWRIVSVDTPPGTTAVALVRGRSRRLLIAEMRGERQRVRLDPTIEGGSWSRLISRSWSGDIAEGWSAEPAARPTGSCDLDPWEVLRWDSESEFQS